MIICKQKKKTGLILAIVATLLAVALLGCHKTPEVPAEEKSYTKTYTDENLQKVTDYYDADGKLEKTISRGTQGVQTTTYTYDENGHVKTGRAVGGTKLPVTYEYACDKDGNILKKTTSEDEYIEYSYEDGVRTLGVENDYGATYTYTYDTNGNVLTKEEKHSDGNTITSAFAYDANGNVLTKEEKHSDDNTITSAFAYDANGNVLTEERKYSDGDSSTFTYTYDANGNVLTEEREDSDGGWSTVTYTYHANGNMSTVAFKFSNGEWHSFTYDEDGNVLTAKFVSSNGEWHSFTYDEDGNLVSRESGTNS